MMKFGIGQEGSEMHSEICRLFCLIMWEERAILGLFKVSEVHGHSGR